jgi:non-homologous end joining protein Ku
VRKRIRALIDQKVAGGDLTAVEEGRPRAKVVDLMEALKASLAAQGKKERPPGRAPALRKAG